MFENHWRSGVGENFPRIFLIRLFLALVFMLETIAAPKEGLEQGLLNFPFGGDQTMQRYGNFG